MTATDPVPVPVPVPDHREEGTDVTPPSTAEPADGPRAPVTSDEDGSLVTEYGLLAVVAATVAGVLIQWATNGAIVNLFNALIDRTRGLIGA